MSNVSDYFLMPREQFPSWEYFRFFSKPEADCPTSETKQRYHFFWARNGLYYSLQTLGISRSAHVLLPSYVCTAAVEPFRAYGAEVEFYGIGRNCEPNFAEIESKIGPRTEAVLAVHYFGFPQRIGEFRELCDRRKIALIEDCAHVLRGQSAGQSLGAIGDASVFSWRKCLPLYDGAELRLNSRFKPLEINWNKENIPFTLKIAKCLLDRVIEQSSSGMAKLISAGLESAKKLVRKARSVPEGRPLLDLDSNQASYDESLLNQPFSRVSRWLLNHSDIEKIIEKRRKNYSSLQQKLRNVKGIQMLHENLPDHICPWMCPVFFKGMPNAHLSLRERGIPAATWGGVRPQGLDPKQFADADFLYDNLVFLPVHQDLTSDSLQRIIEVVADTAGVRMTSESRPTCAVP